MEQMENGIELIHQTR